MSRFAREFSSRVSLMTVQGNKQNRFDDGILGLGVGMRRLRCDTRPCLCRTRIWRVLWSCHTAYKACWTQIDGSLHTQDSHWQPTRSSAATQTEVVRTVGIQLFPILQQFHSSIHSHILVPLKSDLNSFLPR